MFHVILQIYFTINTTVTLSTDVFKAIILVKSTNCLRSNFPFRKRSLPFGTVVAIFETVVAISVNASSDKNAGVHENR